MDNLCCELAASGFGQLSAVVLFFANHLCTAENHIVFQANDVPTANHDPANR
jgi:hypothetical protein